MGIRVWKDPHFSWRRSAREWMLELEIFGCATCIGLSLRGCHNVIQMPNWVGWSILGGNRSTWRGVQDLLLPFNTLGYAGISSLDCWEQRLEGGSSFSFLPPSFPGIQIEIPALGISSSLPASFPAFPSAKSAISQQKALWGSSRTLMTPHSHWNHWWLL